MGEAFRIAKEDMKQDIAKIKRFHDMFLDQVNDIEHVYLNGDVTLKPGDLITATVEHADEYDLWASRTVNSDLSA